MVLNPRLDTRNLWDLFVAWIVMSIYPGCAIFFFLPRFSQIRPRQLTGFRILLLGLGVWTAYPLIPGSQTSRFPAGTVLVHPKGSGVTFVQWPTPPAVFAAVCVYWAIFVLDAVQCALDDDAPAPDHRRASR